MLCYRDMTFCGFYKTCALQDECHRPATEEVAQAAREFGLPMAYFTSQPECHIAVDGEEHGLAFTTSRPGFMCSTADRDHEAIKRLGGPRFFEGMPTKPLNRLYIDGSLEDWVGFDIPIWLRGTIAYKSLQPCTVYNVAGTESKEAVLHLFEEDMNHYDPTLLTKWEVRGFITYPDEVNDHSIWSEPEKYRAIKEAADADTESTFIVQRHVNGITLNEKEQLRDERTDEVLHFSSVESVLTHLASKGIIVVDADELEEVYGIYIEEETSDDT